MKNILLLLQITLLALACTRKDPGMFVLLNSRETGVTFNNDITESDSLNILDDEFIYNGGGVGVGDFNGDGLSDLYFTGSQVDNKLYLNRGNMKFEDVTGISGTSKTNGQWSSGVNILDINRDGRADIYVCNTFIANPQKRKNLLLVNQGNNEQGIPIFTEQAA
ncbi:MAG: FG-GAP repeat domain-containing protein, partial [Bacteroidota bacterium]